MQEKVERLERTLLATNRSLKKFKKKSKDDLQKHREEMQEVMKKLLSNEKEKKDPILLVTILPSILQTSHISVPGIENICKISLASPDKLWVSDGEEELLQVDFKGHLRQRSVIQYSISHTITGNGNLLFTCGENVKKFKSDGTITTLITSTENVECIHSSRINGDILVGIYCTIPHTETSIGKVIRYDKKGKKLLDIEQDNNGQQLFQVPYDITENKNGDIWTSDKCMAVVVDKSGDHRFNYTGLPSQSSFRPQRICTDVLGYVLVCDNFSSSIHLLSKEGRLLSILLPKQYNMRPPFALCVDDKHNLYLGEYESNIITVFKYLEVTEQ
ncbi:uncharacterized protein LOC134281520 [Saccostrea cucullata]|uniref:uncharacterized protein LOC134281520 n=1 Tax=Saccostrea cuccullata TaxID=36930 RepID=UPI002ED54BA5